MSQFLPRAKHLLGRQLVKLNPGDSFIRPVKGAISLSAGSIGSQLMVIAALPMVAHWFGPESFGQFGVFAGLVALFSFIGPLNYHGAIFLVRSRSAQAIILVICLAASAIVAVIAAPIFILVPASAPQLFPSDHAVVVAILLITVFARSACLVGQAFCVQEGRYNNAAACHLIRSAITVTLWIAFALAGNVSALALYAGALAGACAGLFPLIGPMYRRIVEHAHQLSANRIKATACYFRRFPIFESPAMLLRQASQHLPVLLTGVMFGAAEAGFMALTLQAAIRPAALVTHSIGNVLRREYARLKSHHKTAEAASLKRLSVYGLIMLAAIASAILIAAAPLVPAMVGQRWQSIDLVLIAAAPRLFSLIVARPLMMLLSIDKRHKTLLDVELANVVVAILTILLAAYFTNDFVYTVWAYSISSALTILALLSISLLREPR